MILTGIIVILAHGLIAHESSNGEASGQHADVTTVVKGEGLMREVERMARNLSETIQSSVNAATASTAQAKRGPYLGVVIESIPRALRDHMDIPDGVGLLFSRVLPDSPAALAGLRNNDIILGFNGQLVINSAQLSTLIRMHGVEFPAELEILRRGQRLFIAVQMLERDFARRSGAHNDWRGELSEAIRSVEQRIPGSVRVFIDDDEQVRVDLQSLKDDVRNLRRKFLTESSSAVDSDKVIVEQHAEGLRTTRIHVGERSYRLSHETGSIIVRSDAEGTFLVVHDPDGMLVYRGLFDASQAEGLDPLVLSLFERFQQSKEAMAGGLAENEIMINLVEDLSPEESH